MRVCLSVAVVRLPCLTPILASKLILAMFSLFDDFHRSTNHLYTFFDFFCKIFLRCTCLRATHFMFYLSLSGSAFDVFCVLLKVCFKSPIFFEFCTLVVLRLPIRH